MGISLESRHGQKNGRRHNTNDPQDNGCLDNREALGHSFHRAHGYELSVTQNRFIQQNRNDPKCNRYWVPIHWATMPEAFSVPKMMTPPLPAPGV